MEYICLGSSSSGNAYLFKQDDNCVLVECGFEFKELSKKIHAYDISLGQIQAVFITHSHSDHSKSAQDLMAYGLNIYTPFDDEKLEVIKVGDWLSVIPFKTEHDVNSVGYIFINHITKESTLFINDTRHFKLTEKVKSLKYDYVFIECNHTYRKLMELLKNATNNAFKYERQRDNHLSLIGTKNLLNQLDLSNCKEIYLMHLSSEASEPQIMKSQIELCFNKPTYICRKNGGVE